MVSKPYLSSSHPSPPQVEIGEQVFTDFQIIHEFVRRTIRDSKSCSDRAWAWIDEVTIELNPKAVSEANAGGSAIGGVVSGGEVGDADVERVKAEEIEAEPLSPYSASSEMMLLIYCPRYFDLVISFPFLALNVLVLLAVRVLCGK